MIDVDLELAKMLAAEITAEIDAQIISDLRYAFPQRRGPKSFRRTCLKFKSAVLIEEMNIEFEGIL